MEPQIGVRIDDVLRFGIPQILMHSRDGSSVPSDTSCDKLVGSCQQQLPPISRKIRNDMEDLLQRFASKTVERILKHKRYASDPRSRCLCQGQPNRKVDKSPLTRLPRGHLRVQNVITKTCIVSFRMQVRGLDGPGRKLTDRPGGQLRQNPFGRWDQRASRRLAIDRSSQ